MRNDTIRCDSVTIVLEAFAAVEARDDVRLSRVSHPELQFCWPESLRPGNWRAHGGRLARSWEEVWDSFQPTVEERRMSPRVVACTDAEVAVVWHQRGVNRTGERLDCEIFGLYSVKDGRLARAQMFYFDTVAV